MPTVYRIQCGACGRAPEASGGVAGHVATDGMQGGAVLPDGYLAVRLDNGSFFPLPHPIEASELREQGFTWRQASKEKRLYRIQFKVCHRCGAFHEERQFHEGRDGCTLALIGGVATVLLLKWVARLSWIAALLMGYFGMLTLWYFVMLAMRGPLRKENLRIKLRECSACGSHELLTIEEATRQLLPCPYCRAPQMRYTRAGIS